VKKPQVNYAFIDGNNLHLGITALGWVMDYRKFRTYLREHYGITTAYYFIGYVPGNTGLYNYLQDAEYKLVFKPIIRTPEGSMKGNCDAELVLQAMIDLDKYEKAIIVSSDGDFYCLVNYLCKINKLECILVPREKGCSSLLIKAAKGKLAYMNNLKQKLEYIKKRTP
jgi:uncharacterized LabA/DUF88 family protein